MLSYGWHGTNAVFQSREYHGRGGVRKRSLEAVGLTGERGTVPEVKRPGVELVMELTLGDEEILALGNLVTAPAELVVISAGLKGRT